MRPSTRASPFRLQRLVDQKQIGQQRTQVDRRIQVVDELRADGGLREDHLDRRARVAGVAGDEVEKAAVRCRIEADVLDERGACGAELIQRRVATRQVLTYMTAGCAVLV